MSASSPGDRPSGSVSGTASTGRLAPRRDAVVRLAITAPTTIDPARAQEMMGILVTKALYEGLVRLDAHGHVVPGVSTRWSASEDCTQWTFHLRDDSRFSNGEVVDAAAFVRGWNRATDPIADSETVHHLSGVEGFAERVYGDAATLAGVVAVDERTLRVDLAAPDREFLLKLVQPVASAVPCGAPDAAAGGFGRQPIGNGPFALAQDWSDAGVNRMQRNPCYAGEREPLVDAVEISVLPAREARGREREAFAATRLDITTVEPDGVPDAHRVSTELAGVSYLLPFLHRGVLSSRDARWALNHAIDRAALLGGEGAHRVASSLIPPLFAEHEPLPDRTRHNPDLARRYARRAGWDADTLLPLMVNVEQGHEVWMRQLARQVEDALGIRVVLEVATANEVMEYRVSHAAEGAVRAGWMTDYPTADNVLYPLLHSECTKPDAEGRAHGDNEGRYADAEFDDLVIAARGERDSGRKTHLRRSAERIAIGRDMALIPLWYAEDVRWVAPGVSGLRIDHTGVIACEELHITDARRARP